MKMVAALPAIVALVVCVKAHAMTGTTSQEGGMVIRTNGTYLLRSERACATRYVRVRTNDEVRLEDRQDSLLLELLSIDRTPFAELRFESSYGAFELEPVILENGALVLLLVVGLGGGTGARSEELWVIRSQGRSLFPMVKTPYAGVAGGGMVALSGGTRAVVGRPMGVGRWRYSLRCQHWASTQTRLSTAITSRPTRKK